MYLTLKKFPPLNRDFFYISSIDFCVLIITNPRHWKSRITTRWKIRVWCYNRLGWSTVCQWFVHTTWTVNGNQLLEYRVHIVVKEWRNSWIPMSNKVENIVIPCMWTILNDGLVPHVFSSDMRTPHGSRVCKKFSRLINFKYRVITIFCNEYRRYYTWYFHRNGKYNSSVPQGQ